MLLFMEAAPSNLYCLQCGSLNRHSGAYCCLACEIIHQQKDWQAPPTSLEWAFLDRPAFRTLYFKDNEDYQCSLFVEGLHCSSCVHLLESLPDFCPDISEARVQFSRGLLSIKAKSSLRLSQVMEILKQWGYEARFLDSADLQLDHFELENRKVLKKIAVAGACAGNIMLFVIPIYAGLQGHLKAIFNWSSFFLFLPILFYSASDFYRGAWNGLRFKVVNVDLPITLALWGGFLLSSFNLVRGQDGLYFDSMASFLFLILSARYLLRRVQQNYLKPLRVLEFLKDKKILRCENDIYLPTPLTHVQVGDIIRIEAEQILPFDAVLLDRESLLDLSMMTGESFPLRFSQDMPVLAGSRVLQQHADFRVAQPLQESRLAKLLHELEIGSLQKTALLNLTDRLAQKLILVVFSTALVFFALYASIDFQEAFDRSLALIVLACPCALAFGAPLTYGLALRKAQRRGLLARSGLSFEKILKVKNIFFDKTGTLTEGRLHLSQTYPNDIPVEYKSIILSLEKESFHPVAFALRQAWQGTPLLQASSVEEILGQGISGEIEGEVYTVKFLSESVHENYLGVVLLKQGESLCRLYFEDPLRVESRSLITELEVSGLQCFLLSGDRKQRVAEVAKLCGIKTENTFGELYPEDKRDILKTYNNTCMIGDGANDALSLNAADVGIVLQGSLPLNLKAADVYFLKKGLQPLREFIALAQTTRRVLYRNLTLSLLYNIVGGLLALFGFINPLWAAVLMPVSSSLIVLSTLWGFR